MMHYSHYKKNYMELQTSRCKLTNRYKRKIHKSQHETIDGGWKSYIRSVLPYPLKQ
jgi:hypothetical protein